MSLKLAKVNITKKHDRLNSKYSLNLKASKSNQSSPISSRLASLIKKKKKRDIHLEDILSSICVDPLTYENLEKVLKLCGMKNNLHSSNIWKLLSGDIWQGVTKQSFSVFMQAIWDNNNQEKAIIMSPQALPKHERIGKYEGEFSLTEEEVQWVHLKYAPYFLSSNLFQRKASDQKHSFFNTSFEQHLCSRRNSVVGIESQREMMCATEESITTNMRDVQVTNNSFQDLMPYQKAIADPYIF